MTTSTSEDSPAQTAEKKTPNPRVLAILEVIESWKARVQALGLKRGTDEYHIVQNEFWLGACLMANALKQPLHPVIVIYIMAGRDILSLEEKLREKA